MVGIDKAIRWSTGTAVLFRGCGGRRALTAMFERDYPEPFGYQLYYAQCLSHFNLPYPEITT